MTAVDATSEADETGSHAFDRAIAVTPRSGSAVTGGPGDGVQVHDAVIDGGWAIGDKPNGGYLLAVLARAAVATASTVEGLVHGHPVTSSAQYVAAPEAGPAEVHAEVLRRGRRLSQVRARLVQAGSVRVESVFTLGQLDAAAEPWWDDVPMPAFTPEAECVRNTSPGPGGVLLPITDRVEVRLDPQVTGFARGRPTGHGEVRGWMRFADGRSPDPFGLLLAVDVLPPATFDLGTTGWVPTLSLTAYVRAVPAPGPLAVRQWARLVQSDLVDEGCDVWDSRGRLVAQATQLAAVRVGDGPPVPRQG